MINIIEGGITAAKGFGAASFASGIKNNGDNDMTLILSTVPCTASGKFSTNTFESPSVKWNKSNLFNNSAMQAILVTSGNANACNGTEGMNNCRAAADAVAFKLLISNESVLIASSGEIGIPLPMDKVFSGIKYLGDNVEQSLMAGTIAAETILTSDVSAKEIAFSFTLTDGTVCTIGGCCKGSSAAKQDMSTVLAFITTDIAISEELLQNALEFDVDLTYEMIARETGDSPNDAVIIMANGLAGNKIIDEKNEDYQLFVEVLHEINTYFSKKIAVDSEYRMSLFECHVVNAKNRVFARKMARSVASSYQTRILFQNNSKEWGAVIAEMGNIGLDYDNEKITIVIESRGGRIEIFEHGKILSYDRGQMTAVMAADELTMTINMDAGKSDALAWGRGLYIIDVESE